MFTSMISSIFGKTQTQVAATQAPAMPVVHPAAMMSVSKPVEVKVETKAADSFSCLNDIFGEMIEDQHPLSMSKWETSNSATR